MNQMFRYSRYLGIPNYEGAAAPVMLGTEKQKSGGSFTNILRFPVPNTEKAS
ncbi:hypothetical protein J7E79_26905 [Bacillus sp. ISL-40]|uniref:hypothetical protein n=1 Tax=unclassified Bacillus (in: firmicutes) TaxID=185979 RepID=UPI001BEAD26B|nr:MULTISPECIES: hypothetical protein [unclassified Bacillus (in: firmicutes)]MBT2700930.1 hypothetical protein [Bacillus sp. ISL-40]MBT2742972.1 hypothetical protein [Bacillus sp. ISL-77]